jgi:hypothetical protein
MLVRGARPGKLVLGGMGDSGLMEAGARAAMFEDSIRHGDAAKDPRAGRRVHAMMAAGGLKPEAMLGVLTSFAATSAEEIAAIDVAGLGGGRRAGRRQRLGRGLAAMMPDARGVRVPGDHLSAVMEPALAEEIVGFLGNRRRALAPYGSLRDRLPPQGEEEPVGAASSAPYGGGQTAKRSGGGKWVSHPPPIPIT